MHSCRIHAFMQLAAKVVMVQRDKRDREKKIELEQSQSVTVDGK